MIEEYREPEKTGGIGKSVPPEVRARNEGLFAETEQDLAKEDATLRLLARMAILLERDRLLQTLSFPPDRLGRAAARYLSLQPEAFTDRSRMEQDLNECAWHVLPSLVSSRFVDETQRHILAALKRREDRRDQKALITALILCRLDQSPEEMARNGLWNFLFRRSLLELLELPGQDMDLPDNVRDQLRRIPLAALHPKEESAKARGDAEAADRILEDVFHGLEAGYLREHVGFSYVVRVPFAVALLFPDPTAEEAERKDPQAEDRLMMATLESVAQEGAEMGVVDDMLRLYRRAHQAASGERERYFYAALVAVLETYTPAENPVLPALYYEHYLYYLSRAAEEEIGPIREILKNPLEVAPYERYMRVLQERHDYAARDRVGRIRDEVREWQAESK
jgi:hypothetical protein